MPFDAEYEALKKNILEESALLDRKLEIQNTDPFYMPFNDAGNVERLWAWFRINYIYTELGWWRWNGKIWEKNADGKFLLEVGSKFQMLRDRAKEEESGKFDAELRAAKSITSFFNSCCNLQKLKCMTEMARAKFKQPDSIFDANPDLFNFNNGTMNLRTGELQGFSSSDFITKTAGYDIKLDGDCPTFKKLICDAMGQDDEKISFLINVLGSSLSGNVKDEIILLNHGAGSNGKSTLFGHVMLQVMGDYGAAVNIKSFLDGINSRQIGPRPDLIALMGVRYATMSEPPVGASLDEALIKSFTSGEPVRCRDLRKGDTQFFPCLHLFMSYNLEPKLKDFSDGMRRRLKKLEWNVQFEKSESFKENLKKEIPSIAWFLVQACREWYRAGLTIPDSVKETTENYFFDENPVAQFVEMYLDVCVGTSMSNSDLWSAWELACEEQGWDLRTKRFLTQNLRDLKFQQSRGKCRRWERLSVKKAYSDDTWRDN